MGDDLTPSFGSLSTKPPVPPATGAGSPPPLPPPLPPPVPPAAAGESLPPLPPADSDAPSAAAFRIDTRRSRQAPAPSDGGTAVVVSLLLVTAAGTLAYVAWPTVARQLRPGFTAPPTREVAPSDSPAPPAPDARPAPRPKPPIATSADPAPATTRESGDGDQPRTAAVPAPAGPPAASAPASTAARSDPPAAADDAEPDAGPARARVDAAIRAAALALRSGDLATADERLAAAETAAGDDPDALERAAAWRRLLIYAEGFGPLRDQALAASVGKEYTVDGKVISVVEVNDRLFIYRRLGRNVRIARDEIPRAIIVDIVTDWFRRANRPANELFLGAYHVCREPPNVERARAAWQRARRGGEADADLLLPLLDDPALVAPAP